MRLTNILGASNAIAAIRQRHEEGMVVAGTSAGAACQSHTMVYGGPADDCLRKGAVKMAAGFGFVDDVIVDTHFLERGRFSRLMEVGATNPEYLGVGLGEDAAVMFDGPLLRVFGSGHVILIDSTGISGSNVFDLADGEAISVHNVTMHALVEGYARKTDLGWAAGGGAGWWGGLAGAGGGSYQNTQIGQVIVLAYLDAYTKLVDEMGGLPYDAAEDAPLAQ